MSTTHLHHGDNEAATEPDTLEAQQEILDHKVSTLRWVSALMPVVIFVILLFLIPLIVDSRDNSKVIRDGNDLASCRSAWNAKIVTPAQDRRDAEQNRGQTALLHGLAAVAKDDGSAVAEMATAADADAVALDKAQDDLTDARARYAALVHQSARHPSAFLADCRRNGLTSE